VAALALLNRLLETCWVVAISLPPLPPPLPGVGPLGAVFREVNLRGVVCPAGWSFA